MYQRSKVFVQAKIAGVCYSDFYEVFDELKTGTGVRLEAEPDNPYDPNAVAIYYKTTRIGYIPKGQNYELAALLYFGYGDIFDAKVIKNIDNDFDIIVKIKDKRSTK
jgi:hypothetical protein